MASSSPLLSEGSREQDDQNEETWKETGMEKKKGGGGRPRVVGFQRASLLQDLKSILQEYPDNGQIFKEMFQNAEDARARVVKILSVTSPHARHDSLHKPQTSAGKQKKGQTRSKQRKKSGREQKSASVTAWKPPLIDVFSMPGLIVYNDALFTDEDWEGIRKLRDSVKVKDPLKVGRFGLGFKSVFHLTDHPVIISNRQLLFMDPFREEQEAIFITPLSDLLPEERQKLHHALSPLLSKLEANSLTGETFQGTAFWFPLRQEKSELSDTVYTHQRVQQLKQALRAEISTMLLFLKRLEKIEVYSCDYDDPSCAPAFEFSVGLNEKCVKEVRQNRQQFLSKITTPNKACPINEASICSHLTVDRCLTEDGHLHTDQQHWVVVHFHQGLNDMSVDLRDLCQRKSLSHRPYVGVATRLDSPPDRFQGQLFSFLPLPPEQTSPTGFPVHVHGFFELSANRCHVKWPVSESREQESGPCDDLMWNRLLVSETLPRAYVVLLTQLAMRKSCLPAALTGETNIARFLYHLCPDSAKVTTHWLPLLPPLYQALRGRDVFFTPVKGGHWVYLHDAVLMTSPADDLDAATEEAVVQVHQECEVNLVCLPQHVMTGLKMKVPATEQDNSGSEEAVRDSTRSENMKMVCPEELSNMMKHSSSWSETLTDHQKQLLLHYLCQHGNPTMLQDLQLFPMADGSFQAWCDQQMYVCRDGRDLQLLPGLHHQLCWVTYPSGLQHLLQNLVSKGFGRMEMVTEENMPHLLKDSLEKEHLHLNTITVTMSSSWLRQVWDYLRDKDLQAFDLLPLLPCHHGEGYVLKPLLGNYVCASVKGLPPASPHLSSALVHLGVDVLPSLPDFVLQHEQVLHTRVQAATCMGVLKNLAVLSEKQTTNMEAVVQNFNIKSQPSVRSALVEVLNSKALEQDSHWERARPVLRRLKLFSIWPYCGRESPASFSSVEENGQMTPSVNSDKLPPALSLCPQLLYCAQESSTHLNLASALGAQEVGLDDLVREVLSRLLSPHHGYLDLEITEFMIYFMQSDRFTNSELTELARKVCFVPSIISGKLCKPEELFDPESQLLQDLFAEEDLFPNQSFYSNRTSILGKLKPLGLCDVTSITDTHLINTARKIEKLCLGNTSDFVLAERKAKALWKFLLEHGQRYPQDMIRNLANVRCLPCMTSRDCEVIPPDYSRALPVCPAGFDSCGIARAVEMCDNSQLKFVGSVKPVSLPVDKECFLQSLFYTPSSDDVIEHLKVVISTFEEQQSSQHKKHFSFLLVDIFKKLQEEWSGPVVSQKMSNIACIMTEGHFWPAGKFWVQENDVSDISLTPYRFPLPLDLVDEDLVEFFVACGCRPEQDLEMLQQVLQEIQNKYQQSHHSEDAYRKDVGLVLRILEAVRCKEGCERGETLLPVHSSEDNILHMRMAKECTVAPDSDNIEALAEEEGLILVDCQVDPALALHLGALDMKKRTLTGVDDLDVDDSSFGQYEPLTTRLHNLLKDGYTDGFSVPKELIQNADDAGAKVIKFLLDHRQNREWRTGLLTEPLADFQGPALWVFNDAQFSDSDFNNLCKLGGATKKEDCSKVGKFGLGFNAVYNLTDLPSVYSASVLAMMDPHEKYLNSGRGKKMNFRNPMNKLLLKRMPNQFKPFEDVFECDILNKDWEPYPGTLFRFPFRTEAQALKSEICKESFSESNQEDFVNGLREKGGNLLLFLQNVTRLELHDLPQDSRPLTDTQQLLVGSRVSNRDFPEAGSILRHFSTVWNEAVEHGQAFEEKDIVELVTLSFEGERGCGNIQTCRFCIAWASGRRESCEIARETKEEGFVPLAAVGVSLDDEGKVQTLDSCSAGFYKKGHLFCFLPLAEEVSAMTLPVHINAPFALSSDRRSLLCETEDDRKSVSGRWNKALFSDPIPRAYLAALQGVAQSEGQNPAEVYYSLWPQCSSLSPRTPQSALFPNFYRILQQEEFRVFLHRHGAVSFSMGFFLDPDFKQKDVGQAAFRVLNTFWQITEWSHGGGSLVDLPFHIATNIRSSGPSQHDDFQKKVIREEQFFQDVLFPRIEENHPDLQAHDRNQLVLYALLSDNPALQDLVRRHCCIPCVPDGSLNIPARLIHPQGKAAQLFSEEDGRFPTQEDGADFTSPKALTQLMKMGMVKDKVSAEELHERASSVRRIGSKPAAIQRSRAIIKYLPVLEEQEQQMESYIKALASVCFLPSLQKPKDWPVSWFVAEHPGHDFIQPSQACCTELKELVGCVAAVMDENQLDLSATGRETLEKLGVIVHRAKARSKGPQFTQLVVDNLLHISEEVSDLHSVSGMHVGKICHQIYKFFNTFCEGYITDVDRRHQNVVAQLKDKAVVWTEERFLRADQLAFEPADDFGPYLITLNHSHKTTSGFFKFLGVPRWFPVTDILGALRQIREDFPSELSDAEVELIRKIASLLRPALSNEHRGRTLKEDETQGLHLPGRDMHLHPVGELCLNDCDWLTDSGTMCFLHPAFSEHLAEVFCVRTKREHDEDEFCESFGQQEQLTTRINRLLEGYRRDDSIFKELLQNADDAGASEVVFVKDMRYHCKDRLLSEDWGEVYSPALCVFNDSCFTPKDMSGIQALGEGSKEGDALKTGKYGVGFNAVYNLTDTPCFWTTVIPDTDDTGQENNKQLGQKLCVLDPNFFVVNRRRSKLPGQRLSITDRFKEQYPNMLSPFDLGDITEGRTGTVFRLPLRTQEKAYIQPSSEWMSPVQTGHKSKIRQPAVSMKVIDHLLRQFQHGIGESLLFLSHVKKVSVYTAHQNGTFELDYQTQISTDESNSVTLQDFGQHVQGEARKLKRGTGPPQLQDFAAKEAVVLCHLSDSEDKQEDWLVVHKFGLAGSDSIPPCLQSAQAVLKYRLLPLGGVAVCLSAHRQQSQCQTVDQSHQFSHSQQHGISANTSGCNMHVGGSRLRPDSRVIRGVPQQCESRSLSGIPTQQRLFHAFCMLPLPVATGLPVHVNARFALDHETRSNLFSRPGEDQTTWNTLLANSIIVPAYIRALCEITSLCFSSERESISAISESPQRSGRRRLPQIHSMAVSHEHLSISSSTDLHWKLEHYSSFFPQHQNNVDAFWNHLVTSFYRQLAETEAEVFPSVRKDLKRLLWVPAARSDGFPGYFCDLKSCRLKDVLMKLNMNIVQSPFRIHESFIRSEVSTVKQVQRTTVIKFLQSCHQPKASSCNLKNLPQPVENTSFEVVENVFEVFRFIQDKEKSTDLRNVPLSLRSSGKLHCFSSENPTIVSIYCDLLPQSSEHFLHKKLLELTPDSIHGQGYLEKLDIMTFVKLLPSTLPKEVFGCGEIIQQNELPFPLGDAALSKREWITRLWEFLDSQRPAGRILDGVLDDWSLLPSWKDTEALLFPLKKKDEVVHILKESMSDCSSVVDEHGHSLGMDEHNVNQCLGKLTPHLNILSTNLLPISCVAKEIVASVQNPKGLLTALTHERLQTDSLSTAEARSVLEFFYKKLGTFHSSVMRFLPFFERPDGALISLGNTSRVLCLPQSVPLKGLNDWSGTRNIVLVRTKPSLQKLYQSLDIEIPTPSQFYIKHLLSGIAFLPREAIPVHMEYIRDYLLPIPHNDSGLLDSLRQTQFIIGCDGTLCRASEFYNPDCKVFKVMLTKGPFPPAPYDGEEWKAFLKKTGLVCTVSESMFLEFVRQVEEAGKKEVSERVRQQSCELSCYLKESDHLRCESFLRQLKDIRFLLPLRQHEMRSGKHLASVHPVFTPLTSLISFSEGLSARWVFEVWTTSCLFSAHADPSKFSHWKPRMDDWIGFKGQPSKELVIRHVKNVCQSLGLKRQDGSLPLTTFEESTLEVVEQIMDALYTHLTNNFEVGDLQDLHEVSIILDRKNKSMFSGQQVVINILPDQIVEGHVMRAPEALGRFFPLFRRLGACEEVSVDHYARASEEVHMLYLDNFLNPNDLMLVKKIVHCLFTLLKSDHRTLTRPTLYLPAEDISKLQEDVFQVRLMDSRKILLEVNRNQQCRIKVPINNLAVFVSFSRLGLENYDLHRDARLLPESFRMKEWHEVVRETLMESCRTLAKEDDHTRALTNQLHSETCADVVKRIVNHGKLKKGQKFTEDDAKKIEEGLKKVIVLKVANLQSVLEMDGSQLPGTSKYKTFFVTKDVKDSENGQIVSRVSLYTNSNQQSSITLRDRDYRFYAQKAILWAVGYSLDKFLLDICLEDLSHAEQQLDEKEITPYHIQRQITVFPPPGSFVPDEMHHLLDQDVYEYKVSEYVAYELYDPLLDPPRTDSQDAAEETEAATAEEEQEESTQTSDCSTTDQTHKKKPVYIFAQVREVLHPACEESDVRTRLMLLCYVIDIGEEETKKVQAMELYKFIRPSLNVVVPFTGDTTQPPSAFSESDKGDDLKKVLADIRHQLQEIWRNFTDKSRRRAVKRLLLKWHPDKNPGREKFCTKVFQQIQRYVHLLEQGRQLPSEDDEDDDDSVASYTPTHRSYHRRSHFRSGHFYGFSSHFFDNIFSRGQSYAESNRSFNGGGGRWRGASFSFFYGTSGSSYATPQPEEGKRWMRQAKQDLKAARVTLSHGGEGLYNWACYQAHQTAEKALKAVLYQRDANHGMKYSHELCQLASMIGDATIQQCVNSLHNVAQAHTRMRYPDLLVFPKIPSDIYDGEEACQACEVAEEIVNRAQELFDTYRTPPRQPSPPRPPPASRRPSPPRPGPSHSAIAGSSSCSIDSAVSRSASSAPRLMASGQQDEPPSKVRRLDSSVKALPPPP